MVFSTLAALRGLVQDDMTEASVADSEYETAYTATSGHKINTSVETYTEQRYRQKKEHKKKDNKKEKKRSSSRGQRRNTSANNKVNNCPSCKQFKHRKAHPQIPHVKWMWNKRI